MLEYLNAVRLFSPSLRRFLLAVGLATMVFFGVLAVLQNLYLLRLGYEPGFVGLVLGFGQLVWAAVAIPAGIFSARIGLRNGLIVGAFLEATGISLFLLVQNLPQDLWRPWLMGSQGLTFAGVSLAVVSITPYLMVVTGERERRYAFAVFQSVIPITAFLGSVVASLLPPLIASGLGLSLDDAEPYRLALWIAPPLLLSSIVPLLGADPGRVTRPHRSDGEQSRSPLCLMIFFGLLVFLTAIGEGMMRSLFNVYLDIGLHVPTAQIGVTMGLAQLLPIVAALSAPFAMARWGVPGLQLRALPGLALCMIVLALVPIWAAAALGYMGALAMIALNSTARDLFGQELVAVQWRTNIAAMAMVGLGLGFSTAGALGGYLIENFGFTALYTVGASSVTAAFVLLLAFMRRSRLHPQPVETQHAAP